MAVPTIIQNQALATTVTPFSEALNDSVTAGSTLVLVATIEGNNFRTFSISDDKANTWVGGQETISGRVVAYYYATNVAAGTTTITVDVVETPAMTPSYVRVYELSDCDLDVSSSFVNASFITTHYAGAVGQINTAADVMVIAGGVDSVNRTITGGGSFTVDRNSGSTIIQRRSSASALSAERGPWTTSGNTASAGIIRSFVAAGGGGGFSPWFASQARGKLIGSGL